ncbi:MAG: hypothetical protein QOE36_2787 [Gaiellaceae bacterium]|nr:hypothetical protein [Gaiellaceae bacterium]
MKSALPVTPRPAPSRLLPALGGALVLGLALAVFLIAGWTLTGWALGAVLWLALQALELLLTRIKARTGNLAASGVQAFAMLFKALALLVVLVATAATHPNVAVAAALTFALAYTFELGLSMLTYFGAAR